MSSNKIQKNLKFCGIEGTQVRKVRANFRAIWTFQELMAKEKNINLYAVNSKFKKNSKKFLKNNNLFGIKEAWVRKALAIFCDQMASKVL